MTFYMPGGKKCPNTDMQTFDLNIKSLCMSNQHTFIIFIHIVIKSIVIKDQPIYTDILS